MMKMMTDNLSAKHYWDLHHEEQELYYIADSVNWPRYSVGWKVRDGIRFKIEGDKIVMKRVSRT
jgi:hypothetical protein